MSEAALRRPDAAPPLTDREFAAFQALVYRGAGIALHDGKRQLLAGRLARRLRELDLPSFGAYHDAVMRDRSGAELTRMLDLVTTNETRFFREPGHYEHLAQRVLPRWRAEAAAGRRRTTVRVWSAGCSTGQEPFSLAMLLAHHLPVAEGWQVEILASDLSTRVLRQAEGATWPVEKAAEIPEPFRRRFMLRGTGEQRGLMRATPELRRMIRFARINLHEDPFPAAGSLDLVFCRNVLIYFSPEGRRAVVRRLVGTLAPEGELFVGHAESLHEHAELARAEVPAAYRRRPA